MSNVYSLLSTGNTFGDWIVTTNALAKENNDLAANTYHKATGTLFLDDSTLGLQVNSAAIFAGTFRVTGTGSAALVQNNLTVQTGQVYFQNTIMGLTNSGQANINGLLIAQGPNTSLYVANTANINGTLNVVGTSTFGNTVSVLGATALSNTLTVGAAATMSNTLTVIGNTNVVGLSASGQLSVNGDFTSLGTSSMVSTVFTGTPTSPTPATNTSNTMIATTAFVQNQLNSGNTYTHNISGTSTGLSGSPSVTVSALSGTTGAFSDTVTSGISSGLLQIGNSAGSYATIRNDGNLSYNGGTLYPIVRSDNTRYNLSVNFPVNIWNTSSEGYNRLHFTASDSTYLSGVSGGWYVRIGDQSNNTRSIFTGGGDFYTNGNVIAYWSDKRLKKNINKISDWREIINGLNGYRYEWNDLGRKILDDSGTEDGIKVGLIAQEVQSVLPQAAAIQMMQYKDNKNGELIPKDDINYDPENPYLTVKEEKLIPVLVEAVKGLMEEIEELKREIKELKKK